MTILYRIQEFLADNFKGFQYPNITKAQNIPEWQSKRGSLFIETDKNSDRSRISFEGKIILFCFSFMIFIIGGGLIAFGFFILWALLRNIF